MYKRGDLLYTNIFWHVYVMALAERMYNQNIKILDVAPTSPPPNIFDFSSLIVGPWTKVSFHTICDVINYAPRPAS